MSSKSLLPSVRSDVAAVSGNVARIGYGIAVFKLSASSFGSESLPVIGQLLALSGLTLILASGGIQRGIAVLIGRDRSRPQGVMHAATRVTMAAGAATSALMLITSLARGFGVLEPFPTPASVLLVAALAPVAGWNTNAVSALAGGGRSTVASGAQAIAATTGTVVAAVATLGIGSFEVLQMALAGQPLVMAACLAITSRRGGAAGLAAPMARHAEGDAATVPTRSLLSFAPAAVLPVVAAQVTRLSVRSAYAAVLGLTVTGRWEAVVRIQDGYVQVLGAYLVMVALPALSAADDSPTLARAMTRRLMGLSAPGILVLAVLGRTVMTILYSPDLASAGPLLLIVITGEVLRIPYHLWQYHLLAAGRVRTFVRNEVVFTVATAVGVGSWAYLGSLAAGLTTGAVLAAAAGALGAWRLARGARSDAEVLR